MLGHRHQIIPGNKFHNNDHNNFVIGFHRKQQIHAAAHWRHDDRPRYAPQNKCSDRIIFVRDFAVRWLVAHAIAHCAHTMLVSVDILAIPADIDTHTHTRFGIQCLCCMKLSTVYVFDERKNNKYILINLTIKYPIHCIPISVSKLYP